MQLTDKIFKGLYRRGVMLEQMKEPALSRTVKQMEPAEPCENPRDIDTLSPEEILRAAEEADIVDETDGRPLAEKLREAMGSGTMLFIDAIDDEPYVSSQMGPMLALRDQCAGGIRLAARALGTTDATVLVYRHISDSEVAIPRNIGGIPIKRVGGKYPAQCQMEEELAERYSGKGSWLLCGACAMIHLYRAAVEGRPQTTTFVTVAGNCVGFPRNVEAPLGTPVLELLKLCGLTERPTRVILGGPLTGTATEDLRNEKVELSTTAVLAIRDDKHEYSYTCIGCGRCTAVCPQGLNPMRILQELRRGNRRAVEELGIEDCTQCTCCSYICPSRQSVAGEILLYRQKMKGGEEP
jgi:electron transport complex protein RnfC